MIRPTAKRTTLIGWICSALLVGLSACSASDVPEQRQPASISVDRPERVRLIPDSYHLNHVGRQSDGSLYWIDVQLNFDRAANSTRDFACLYIFGPDGALISHQIEDLGLRSSDQRRASHVITEMMQSLSAPVSTDIWVRPFSVDHDGLRFGLIVRETEIGPVVDAEPGMTLMFFPPWSNGEYDT